MQTHSTVARLALALAIIMALVTAATVPADAGGRQDGQRTPRVAGMVIVESDRSFDDTWSTLIGALEANPNITIVAQIDHAAAASSVGLDLDPNRVVVFGNPNLGAPLMAINQITGLDLPQKIHVFVEDGRVWVGFNDTTFLRNRHRLGDAPTLETISGALRTLAGVATDRTVDQQARPSRSFQYRPGLVTIGSDADIDTTWDRLLAAIDASPAAIAYTVDHEAAAAAVAGIDLRPTRLVVFGNPNLGTPLMQAQPTAGIDLPIRFLVWEDADGQVFVTTNDERLARRHRIRRNQLDAIASAVETFLTVATTTPD